MIIEIKVHIIQYAGIDTHITMEANNIAFPNKVIIQYRV